ncbi:hypothetical protein [Bacillus taeanensis]|uniref:DoxX family membrane protein n=1 Tax=Bacillus taeanensis TaxID=273032 RepID=A0A366XWZ6_9BACI|nr:hypothetical protein [Bacillus taeanensis]RBW69675.1 hypothetical protein DS031_10655 [Bacillus taeanensis]
MKIIKNGRLFAVLIVLIRFLFGLGWLLAGVTKITEKLWFKEPGVFLNNYLLHSLQSSNVPAFYKTFIETIVLEHVLVLNYMIPIAQIILGLFLITGLFILPSILICLFMHINFILSGNMNLISLILYTNAFSLLMFRSNMYSFSLDKYFHLDTLFINKKRKIKTFSISAKKEKLSVHS